MSKIGDFEMINHPKVKDENTFELVNNFEKPKLVKLPDDTNEEDLYSVYMFNRTGILGIINMIKREEDLNDKIIVAELKKLNTMLENLEKEYEQKKLKYQ